MADSLTDLETRLGRPAGGAVSIGSGRIFTFNWPCGCVATGSTLQALEVTQFACKIHPPERSMVTQTRALPDPARLASTDAADPSKARL